MKMMSMNLLLMIIHLLIQGSREDSVQDMVSKTSGRTNTTQDWIFQSLKVKYNEDEEEVTWQGVLGDHQQRLL